MFIKPHKLNKILVLKLGRIAIILSGREKHSTSPDMNESSQYQPPIIESSSESLEDSVPPQELTGIKGITQLQIEDEIHDRNIVFTTMQSPAIFPLPAEGEAFLDDAGAQLTFSQSSQQSSHNTNDRASSSSYSSKSAYQYMRNQPCPPELPPLGVKPKPPKDSSFKQMDIHDDESLTESDDEVPQSIQFETDPFVPNITIPTSPFTALPNRLYQRNQPLRSTSQQTGIASWRDVRNLDIFLSRIYYYYKGKGFLCIVLAEVTNLMYLFNNDIVTFHLLYFYPHL